MSAVFFFVAAVLFAVAGLTPVFDWDLGEFHVIAWGLTSLALGLVVLHSGEFDKYRGRHRRDVL